MSRFIFAVAVLIAVGTHSFAGPKLLLAVASYRDRAKYPTIYFYEHDGKANGKMIGSIPSASKRSDSRPSLTLDGRYCAFASEQENKTSKILLWDRTTTKLVELPKLNDSPHAQLHPCLSGDGKLLAFAAWNRPGVSQRWDVLFYDVPKKQLVDVPGVSTQQFDERMPCLCASGRYVAYVSNAKSGRLTDVRFYDRKTKKAAPLAKLNSEGFDVHPSISGDGRLIAFSSDRPGGKGGRDVYLFDRSKSAYVPLPGLNSAAHEQSPSLSADGRYVAFVSERISGTGERDVYLYDIATNKLLPTPGLNCEREDMDPCVIVITKARKNEKEEAEQRHRTIRVSFQLPSNSFPVTSFFVLSSFRDDLLPPVQGQRTTRLITTVGALKLRSSPVRKPVAFRYDLNWAK